jgi:hypothetical protein
MGWNVLLGCEHLFCLKMFPKITISSKGPGAAEVRKALDAVAKMEVLIGIPQEKDSRLRGIPARPVIQPAIQAEGNKQAIAEELKQAGAAQLQGDPEKATRFLRRAGTTGANAAKAWFTDARNNWAPNAPATIRRKGSSRPGINTGAMRRAITWVVK